ncbi:MAG: hypothetical protein HFJ41_08290 [Clostridia bacterium]|jgi:hypothetical protein|nr:hypothetical protein [Clostridia bacterium]
MLYYIGVLKSVPGKPVKTVTHNIFPGMHINHIVEIPIIINTLEKNASGILFKQHSMRDICRRRFLACCFII